MTQDSFPIASPSEELVLKWDREWHAAKVKHMNYANYIATQAANWGADQELKACCEWFFKNYAIPCSQLRAIRRPKPPSLKEQALTQLDSLHADLKTHGLGTNTDTIRSALEQLND